MNQNLYANVTLELPHDLGEKVYLEVCYKEYYDGIGPYEFFGTPGYDKGELVKEILSIKPTFEEELPAEIMDKILNYINDNQELIIEKL